MNEQKIQFIDIYDVWYQPWWKSAGCYAFCMGLVCLIVIFVVYYVYSRGLWIKKLSPDQQALKNLNILTVTLYDSQEKIYAAYFQLTLILKTYFAFRYHVSLVDKTDLEVIALLKNLVEKKNQELLEKFLQQALTIKFAHDAISEQMLRDDINVVKKIITDTVQDLDKVGRF